MTFYIVRHAEKDQGDFLNPQLRHQDPPINEKGRQDAKRLYTFFSDKQITVIYVSAFRRTPETVEDTPGQLNLRPEIDNRLNEIDNGLVEGLTDQQLREGYPKIWQAYLERSADFRFPGGETGKEAQERITGFLEEKRGVHGTRNILLVSHDGLIRLLMCHIVDLPVYKRWQFYVDTCGIMKISYEPAYETWKLIRFNHIVD
jgi:broad specificity phosphatase PhoE